VRIESDPWLAGLFGCEVFRVTLPEVVEAIAPAILFSAAVGPRAFFYAKAPVARVAQVGALTAAGFRVIDVNVVLEREPAPEYRRRPPAAIIREAQPADEAGVLAIAETSFVYSRFHLDPQVSGALANTVKREWMASYFRRQRGERVWVTEEAGRPVGFLAVLVTGETDKTGVIDLIGVEKTQQGRGVGRELVEHFVHDGLGKYRRLRVGTQIANVPSLRLYEQCGFRVAEAAYVLHAHVRDGKAV
jgi:ribosomal protein S18 acetylase RimI-like enzyme